MNAQPINQNNFDFLRFIFAFVVLFRHTLDLSQNLTLSTLKPFLNSHVSVMGFFVISGFLIWKSYLTSSNTIVFLKKRARRLLPAYIFFVTFAGIFLVFLSRLTFYNYFSSINLYKYFAYNMIFLNFLQPCINGVFEKNWSCAVNGALWTIKVEVLFYLLVPIMAYFINRMKRKYIFLVIVYITSILYKEYLESFNSPLASILSRQTPGYLCYFVTGVSFYYYFDYYINHKSKLLFLSILILLVEYIYGIDILGPFATACIIFFAAYSFPLFNNFGKKGDFSYGIYIYHFTVIQIFSQLNLFDKYNPYLITVAVAIIVLGMAVFSWHFIEKPFLKRA